jgi:hypothetical protein
MNVNQEVRLNLSADGIPPRLFMPQGDANSRTIVATLWDGAAPYNVPASAAVMVRFRKPDGTGGLYDATEAGTAVTASGNTVTAPVATQMLAVAGVVQAEIDIYGTGSGKAADRLATFRFAVEVAPSVYPDAQIISSDYFNLIAATISKAIEAAAKAELAKTAAQAAQSAAETAQSGAESAEQGAQAAQAAAENAKTAAQTAQQGAKAAQDAAEDAQAAAEGAKSGAQTAQQGAQAAQQGAQTAQQGAQTAQQGAEAAQAAAEYAQAAAASSAAAAAASAANAATSVEGAVKYNASQSLTDAQKQQARDNINAPAPYEAGDNISITGRIITTKAFPCNSILLDNWYFGKPVNQRGQTSYTIVGYTIDRWKLDVGEGITIDNGLNIVKANSYIGQYFNDFDKYIGRQLTGSVLMSDGNLYTGTFTYNGIVSQAQTFFTNSFIGMYIQKISTTLTQVEFNTIIDNVKILAAKLELGSQQTLAHKEYGEWVLNEIPKFGDQLAECQRYYYHVHYSQYQTINMAYENISYAFIMLPLPVAMRIDNPVLTQSKPIALGSSEKIMTAAEANGCMARLGVNHATISNVQKAAYSYCADPEGVTFTLSADF